MQRCAAMLNLYLSKKKKNDRKMLNVIILINISTIFVSVFG